MRTERLSDRNLKAAQSLGMETIRKYCKCVSHACFEDPPQTCQ